MERSLKAIADRLRERMTTRLCADIGPTDVANQIEDILSADRSRAQVRVDSPGADPAMATMLPPKWTMTPPWEARCPLCTRVIESGPILVGGLGYCSFECASSYPESRGARGPDRGSFQLREQPAKVPGALRSCFVVR
jgi:hypothetical protein